MKVEEGMSRSAQIKTPIAATLMVVLLVVGLLAGYFAALSAAPQPVEEVTVVRTTTVRLAETVTSTVTETVVKTVTVEREVEKPMEEVVIYPEDLVEAARKEGKVVVYTTMPIPRFQKMKEVFEERFPGITVEFWRGSTPAVIEKVLSEYRGGIFAYDACYCSITVLKVLHERGAVPKDLIKLKVPDGFPENLIFDYGYGGRLITMVIAYNEELLKPEEVPKGLEDLADPKYKGKIVLPDVITHTPTTFFFMTLREIWGEDRFWSWVEGLLANKPTWRKSTVPAAKAVEAGEAALTLTFATNVVAGVERGSPIGIIWPTPAITLPVAANIAAKPPNPNAAKLLVQFLVWDGPRVLQVIGEESPMFFPDIPVHPVMKGGVRLKKIPMTLFGDDERKEFIRQMEEKIRAAS